MTTGVGAGAVVFAELEAGAVVFGGAVVMLPVGGATGFVVVELPEAPGVGAGVRATEPVGAPGATADNSK